MMGRSTFCITFPQQLLARLLAIVSHHKVFQTTGNSAKLRHSSTKVSDNSSPIRSCAAREWLSPASKQ